MDEQIQDRYDELADQNEIGISHHVYHLLPEKGGEQEVCSSSHWEGPPAYRHWQRRAHILTAEQSRAVNNFSADFCCLNLNIGMKRPISDTM